MQSTVECSRVEYRVQQSEECNRVHNTVDWRVNRVESSRVQKAKENFVSKNRKFLVDAIQNYKKEEQGIHLDIPNLNGAIRMSIESLSFPKDILKQLGDQNGSGRNGKLCNLEAGWLPKKDLDLISEEYCHHILPDQIKQPKTMDERKKERQAHSKEIEMLLDEKRRFDPTVALSYLFS